jgi:hypothetical protein
MDPAKTNREVQWQRRTRADSANSVETNEHMLGVETVDSHHMPADTKLAAKMTQDSDESIKRVGSDGTHGSGEHQIFFPVFVGDQMFIPFQPQRDLQRRECMVGFGAAQALFPAYFVLLVSKKRSEGQTVVTRLDRHVTLESLSHKTEYGVVWQQLGNHEDAGVANPEKHGS